LWFKDSPRETVLKTLSQKKSNNKKGLAELLKWQSICLASVRPSVQIPVYKKNTGGWRYN
jgi:hypothetical protein